MNGILTTIIAAGLLLTFFGMMSFNNFLTLFLVGGALVIIAKVK